MNETLLTNIKSLLQIRDAETDLVKGAKMAELPAIDNAWLHIADGEIKAFGSMDVVPEASCTHYDCSGKFVLPAWCDSHTHIVYAGSRESEFVDKIKGLSYEEIARNGGGILNSAAKLHNTSEDDLYEQALKRANEIISFGTGAVEIKSGYGLNRVDELKMLRVVRRLKDTTPLTIKASFLGAHALPQHYKANRDAYVREITDEMLPAVAAEGLADYVDVFCDKGFFTVEETARILEKAAKYNLQPKIHANELDYSGGIQVGVQYKALSVDHLEYTGPEEIEVLLNSKTMPTLLPSTAFFLRLKQPPAREMIEAGLPVALASDYNPGSSPSGRMSFVLSLACINLRMLPEEVINAATLNGAYAMGVNRDLGSICVGKKANLILTSEIPSLAFIPYAFGSQLIEKVMLNGDWM
ncbi:MAG: imidazolonepropionase [Bacteroidia bacterium]|jgi:imidazolonepropionase